MPRRFTVTEKWTDPWFRKLSKDGKLFFLYLCDNCDIAGFWEIDLQLACFATGIAGEDIATIFKEINKGYDSDGAYIWLHNFLKHQRNLPLNPENMAHQGIIYRLRNHLQFDNVVQILKENNIELKAPIKPLQRGYGKGNGKGNIKGGIVKGGNSKGETSKEIAARLDAYDKKVAKACGG